MAQNPLLENVTQTVAQALAEDIGSGDITAELIAPEQQAQAKIICREAATICGQPWVNEVFQQIDANIKLRWQYQDGQQIAANEVAFYAEGNARALLTAERSALNFLQTLSSAATNARHYANLVKHTGVKILDTRKTLPGLRQAQKYSVSQGGCYNHRIGLFDAFLIKENHINACGGIAAAIQRAQQLHPQKPVEIEVESLAQMESALDAGADIILLDNFSLAELSSAVKQNARRAKLEASGGYDETSIVTAAETGVDYISIGALTKHCRAIDFSMLFET